MDPFKVLGLQWGKCTEPDVTKAYRKLALQNHPDKAGPKSERRMSEINAARDQILQGKLCSKPPPSETRSQEPHPRGERSYEHRPGEQRSRQRPSYDRPSHDRPSHERHTHERRSGKHDPYERDPHKQRHKQGAPEEPSYRRPPYEERAHKQPSHEHDYKGRSDEQPSNVRSSHTRPPYDRPSYEKYSYERTSGRYDSDEDDSDEDDSYVYESYEQPSYEKSSYERRYKQTSYEKPSHDKRSYERRYEQSPRYEERYQSRGPRGYTEPKAPQRSQPKKECLEEVFWEELPPLMRKVRVFLSETRPVYTGLDRTPRDVVLDFYNKVQSRLLNRPSASEREGICSLLGSMFFAIKQHEMSDASTDRQARRIDSRWGLEYTMSRLEWCEYLEDDEVLMDEWLSLCLPDIERQWRQEKRKWDVTGEWGH